VTKQGAGFKSLRDAWADTTSAHGRLMLTVLGGLAEFERDLIRARTGDGRKRAKERGVRFGRPRKLTTHQRQEALQRLAEARRRPTCRAPMQLIRPRLEGCGQPRNGAVGRRCFSSRRLCSDCFEIASAVYRREQRAALGRKVLTRPSCICRCFRFVRLKFY